MKWDLKYLDDNSIWNIDVIYRCWCHRQYLDESERDLCMLSHFRKRMQSYTYPEVVMEAFLT